MIVELMNVKEDRMDDQAPTVKDLARTLKVIADETRLRILGLVVTQPRTGHELSAALELTPATVSHHMRKLVDAGIVIATPDAQSQRYSLNARFLDESRRAPLREQREPGFDGHDDDPTRQRTIRNFFEGDRLRSIPSRRKARVIVLQHLLLRFDPVRSYPEAKVNEILRHAHEDYATLRRELVDYGFMTRADGIYQICRSPPKRSQQVAQEILGDEHDWLQGLLRATIRTADQHQRRS
jgi:biotin operon repressor